jgi:hypothetical protein
MSKEERENAATLVAEAVSQCLTVQSAATARELEFSQALHEVVEAKYQVLGDNVGAVGSFVSQIKKNQQRAPEIFSVIDEFEPQLDALEVAVSKLEQWTKRLEVKARSV